MGRLFDEVDELKDRNGIVVIDSTNVYNYLVLHEQVGRVDLLYPNIAPPFIDFFVEFRQDTSAQIGIHVVSIETKNDGYSKFIDTLFEGRTNKDEKISILRAFAEQCKWLCVATILTKVHESKAVPMFIAIGVMENGSICKRGETLGIMRQRFFNLESAICDKIQKVSLHTLFMTLSFMHCKNVQRVEHTSPPKVQARRVKEGKPPLTKYYTLEIEPMKRVLQTEGNISANGLKRALHICRGHFATYTDDKPLFGKVKGTFWIPQHVRGSKDSGEVIKDYNVKTPAA